MKKKKSELTNKNISLISSNCNGACILHDLGERFNTPFVNLWIKPHDFLKMLIKLEYYMSCELVITTENGINYPIGMLDDIKIYFLHYNNFQEAKEKWELRKQRIDYEHLFILFTDRDGCTEKDLMDFDNLPYKNKVVFCNKPHPNIKSAVYIHGFEREKCVGQCMNYRSRLSYKKYYDDFDYVKWFNGGLQNS
jgi:uncharacterized protein (DUF1919 family)